jgi:hypothetical protein
MDEINKVPYSLQLVAQLEVGKKSQTDKQLSLSDRRVLEQ